MRIRLRAFFLREVPALLCILALSHVAVGRQHPIGLQPKVFSFGKNESMPYRLFVPESYDSSQKYPLILWFHGSNGRGHDNLRNISGGNELGSHIWLQNAIQAGHPCFVVAPQCPDTTLWVSNDGIDNPPDELDAVVGLLSELRHAYSIDTNRMYVAGQSMGGVAVWEIIARYPSMFAAALPLCAIGNTENAAVLTRTPVWVFHGAVDDVVPVAHAREMVAAIKRAGGHPKYSEYKGVGHDVWNVAFKEQDLVRWVFDHNKNRTAFRYR